ncbi:CRISPR system cascade subunit CasC [mine drainage metagenome]|uniref:CRISPR system cascade subunit CasC n=1 Tax=mine drainage metagenome TaxID=410659 RepID=A0A1J5R2G6_9ZZZZ
MAQFIQLHLLTAYAASNLNRDDTGRPKTLKFGGAERLRISSQSLKRAFRTSDVFAATLPDSLGKRSTGFTNTLVESLIARGLSAEDAVARAGQVVSLGKLGKLKPNQAKTEQLVHLAPEELAAINDLAARLATPETPGEKEVLVLKHKPRAVDIAMFGRMLADNPGFNVEAAVQVAHAFTTHHVTVEDDFYTAVDDIKSADAEDRGAGFIGTLEYGAGLFYLYLCINADLLLDNLAGDKALAGDALEALITAAATVSPSGKQNAFASRGRAGYILQELGGETPRSLAAAFQKPVGAEGENDYFQASIHRLDALRAGYAQAYGEKLATHVLCVGEAASETLADLIGAARAVYGV